MDSDAWGNVVALVGVIAPVILFWVTFSKERKNDLTRLAALASVRESIAGEKGDIDGRVKQQIDESIRVLAAKVAFREYGRRLGKKAADSSLPRGFVIPLVCILLLYGVSALGIGATSIWNPALGEHDLRFWVFVSFFVTMCLLVMMSLGMMIRQRGILRDFETALRDGEEEEYLERLKSSPTRSLSASGETGTRA